AVRIARDVADALDYAHRKDVIHRDIKPANILLHEGRPVVADFGIALAISAAGGGRMTETGLSLGTPHYMSPEQASADRDLSARSDVYSLGCVLYEMLAGAPPHTGPSAQSILVRILTEDPRPIADVRRSVPPNVAATITKAIEKLPADRFETARQFMEALDDPAFTYQASTRAVRAPALPQAAAGARLPASSAAARWLPWAAAAVLAVAAAWGWLRPSNPPAVRRLAMVLDSAGRGFGPSLAVSPDGSRVVYVGDDGRLWLRELQSLDSRPIPETQGGQAPFFAPDGQRVGFQRGTQSLGSLITVSLTGAPPVEVFSGELYPGGSWADDGWIYFATERGALRRVRSEGGSAETVVDTAAGWWAEFPDALPGGTVVLVGTPSQVEAIDVASGVRTTILSELVEAQRPSMARYAGGYLFWANYANTLMAAPFDTRTLEVTGPPVALVSAVVRAGSSSFDFDVSDDGTLIYALGTAGGSRLNGESIGWVGRDGTLEIVDDRLATDVGDFDYLSLGPNARYIAAEVQTGADGTPTEDHQVWVYDLDQNTLVRLTLNGTRNVRPVWLDDRTVAYLSNQTPDSSGIFAQPIDGSGGERRLFMTDLPIVDFAASPVDGTLAVTVVSGASIDIVRVDPAAGTVTPLLNSRFDEGGPAISQDGKWMAYVSNESGRTEVYVRAYPQGDRRAAISINGAKTPRWSRSGDELYYIGLDGETEVAGLEVADGVSVRSRSRLFGSGPFEMGQAGIGATYDVDADDERLLVIVEAGAGGTGGQPNRVIVFNVFEELKARGGR
ncbi:MAG TPA: protein kinase, partial [Longimicrobiales bacterium]|nr:protein kinase [Longimicrobiales bacterium]